MTERDHAVPVLECRGLRKIYRQGPEELTILRDVNLQVDFGELVAVMGQSGSGKSTLLNLLGGLDLPTAGEVWVQGERLSDMNDRDRGTLRNRKLGFVYQFHHLMMEFTAEENVAMPLLIRGDTAKKATAEARTTLAAVGLAHRISHRPAQLSGGERQRVAIARALVTAPCCVLMDEPTGNLDETSAQSVQQLISELNREFATSFIVVTHATSLARSLDRVLELHDGSLHAV